MLIEDMHRMETNARIYTIITLSYLNRHTTCVFLCTNQIHTHAMCERFCNYLITIGFESIEMNMAMSVKQHMHLETFHDSKQKWCHITNDLSHKTCHYRR